MNRDSARKIGLTAALIGGLLGSGARAQQPKADAFAADIAHRLVVGGASGGLVVRLPADMEGPLSVVRGNKRLFLEDRSAYGSWARLIRHAAKVAGSGVSEVAAGPPDPDEEFKSYVAAHPGRFEIDTREAGPPILADVNTRACRAALRQLLKTEANGTEAPMLVSRATAAATGAEVPGGFIGGCIPIGGYRAAPLRLATGQSLQSALAKIAAHFPGMVWVAVETTDGQCSLGVLQHGERENICSSAVTENMAR